MKFKKERLNSLIREELSKIILKELEFDGALITVTEAEFSNDLKNLKIKFSTIPAGKAEYALKILQQNQWRLRKILLKKIRNHSIPYLNFIIDRGLEKAAEVEKLLMDDKI